MPVDYKTQNTTIEGGYNTKQYGFKLAFIDSKFTDANDAVQWTNFYMRSGLDTSLLPPDNELKKWSFNGYIKQLPWDSAIIARFTQSKLTNSFGDRRRRASSRRAAWRPRTGDPAAERLPSSPGRGYLVTQPELVELQRQHQDDDCERRLEREPDGAARHARLLRLLRPAERLDRRVVCPQGSQGTQLRESARSTARPCFTIGALTEAAGEAVPATRRTRRGSTQSWAFNRYNKLLGGFDWDRASSATSRPAPDDRRLPLLDRVPQHRRLAAADVTGRLKYEYLAAALGPRSQLHQQRRSDAGQVPYYFTAYDVIELRPPTWSSSTSTGRRGRCGSSASARRGATPTTRTTTTAARSDNSQQYDADGVVGRRQSSGSPASATGARSSSSRTTATLPRLDRYSGIRCRAVRPTPPTSTGAAENTQDGWMAAALVDWAPTDKLDADDVRTAYRQDRRRRRLQRRRTTATLSRCGLAGGFTPPGGTPGPLVNYDHRQHDAAALPDQGNLQLQQEVGASMPATRTRSTTTATARWRGYCELLPVLPEPRHGAVERQLVFGRVRQPELHDQHDLGHRDLQFYPPPRCTRRERWSAEAEVAPPPPPPPPAAAPATRGPPAPGPAGAEDHARREGAVCLGKAELTPEGKAAIDSQVVAGWRPSRSSTWSIEAATPTASGRRPPTEAVGRTRGSGGRRSRQQGSGQGEDPDPSTWASSRSRSLRRTRRADRGCSTVASTSRSGARRRNNHRLNAPRTSPASRGGFSLRTRGIASANNLPADQTLPAVSASCAALARQVSRNDSLMRPSAAAVSQNARAALAGREPRVALRRERHARARTRARRNFAAGERRIGHGQHVVHRRELQPVVDVEAQVPEVHVGVRNETAVPPQRFDGEHRSFVEEAHRSPSGGRAVATKVSRLPRNAGWIASSAHTATPALQADAVESLELDEDAAAVRKHPRTRWR